MEIQVVEHGKKWIIVKNPTALASPTRGGSSRRGRRTAVVFEACWTGSDWATRVHFAQVFESQEDAKFEVMLKRRAMEQNP